MKHFCLSLLILFFAASANAVVLTYNISNDFSDIESKIIKRALNHVANRMFDPKMFECTQRNYKRWRMRNNYLQKANINLPNTDNFHAYFRYTQMAATGQKPPRVVVKAYSRDDKTTGFAYDNNLVIPQFVTPTEGFSLVPFPKVSGEFVIYLNKWWLGGSDSIGHDDNYWAGTIAHEMLHNLGHHHEKGEYDGMFIRDFENCVSSNGTYKAGFGLTSSSRFEN